MVIVSTTILVAQLSECQVSRISTVHLCEWIAYQEECLAAEIDKYSEEMLETFSKAY